jgi:hypothetical protein
MLPCHNFFKRPFWFFFYPSILLNRAGTEKCSAAVTKPKNRNGYGTGAMDQVVEHLL